MKIFLITLASIFVFISCDNEKKYKTELLQIEIHSVKLDSLDEIINGIQIDSLVLIQKIATNNELTIKTYYLTDTIDMVFAEKMNMNKGVRKSLAEVEKQKEGLISELQELKLQYFNLKTDIIAGLYNKEQIVDYLNVEKLDFDMLTVNIKEFELNSKKQLESFYYANPQISKYCNELLENIEK